MKKTFIIMGMIMASLMASSCGKASTTQSAAVEDAYVESPAAGVYKSESAAYDYDYKEMAEEAPAEYENSSDSGQQAISGRKLIKNVSMDLETREYDNLFAGIENKVKTLGGYIEESSTSGNSSSSSSRYGNILARIPVDKLDDFIEHVANSSNITYKNESVQDVTLQYVDVESRKISLEIERDRLLELLKKADTVADIIEIESRLSEVRYQLESATSQLRVMDNQVDYATVRIGINEVKDYTPPEKRTIWQEITDGLKYNLRDIARGFREFFILLVTSIPNIIVFALCIFIIVKIAKFIRKKIGINKPEGKKGTEKKDSIKKKFFKGRFGKNNVNIEEGNDIKESGKEKDEQG